MSTTEVMIKDISDSKRIDSFIRGNDNPLRRNISEFSSDAVKKFMRYISNELFLCNDIYLKYIRWYYIVL